MTTYTHTASGPRAHLRSHLGSYVAGVGATAALTAGALVVFLSVSTFVAFNGPPFGESSDGAGAAYLDPIATAAPGTAGAALGAAPGAVAKNPVHDSAGSRAGSGSAAAEGSGGSTPGGDDTAAKTPPGTTTDPGTSAPPGNVAPPPVDVPSLPSASGPVTGVVESVDRVAGTNLSGSTGRVTRAADGATAGALDTVGAAADRLGRRAGGAVSGLTGALD